jgi:hypothetical protein
MSVAEHMGDAWKNARLEHQLTMLLSNVLVDAFRARSGVHHSDDLSIVQSAELADAALLALSQAGYSILPTAEPGTERVPHPARDE